MSPAYLGKGRANLLTFGVFPGGSAAAIERIAQHTTPDGYRAPLLSIEYGTYKAVKPRFWPWLSGKCPSRPLFARERPAITSPPPLTQVVALPLSSGSRNTQHLMATVLPDLTTPRQVKIENLFHSKSVSNHFKSHQKNSFWLPTIDLLAAQSSDAQHFWPHRTPDGYPDPRHPAR